MSLLKRIFGICETRPPRDAGSWRWREGRVVVDLARLPELTENGHAVRLEGAGLPTRILLVRDAEGAFRAYHNRCTHMGRRLDYVPESQNIRCCSISKSLFYPSGELIDGPARAPIPQFPVVREEGRLVIQIA